MTSTSLASSLNVLTLAVSSFLGLYRPILQYQAHYITITRRLLIYYTPTNTLTYYNILKFFTLIHFQMLLHVSILRSSSGRIFCSLLKLYVKKLIIFLNISVMRQHIICMWICCICCKEVGRSVGRPTDRPTSLQQIQHIHIQTICCHITEMFKKIINFLTYNFSKEQNILPEDDLRIETCRSILKCISVKNFRIL